MKQVLKTILILLFPLSLFCQPQDSIFRLKKNYLFFLPSAIGGDLWSNLNNIWIELGYDHHLNNKHILGIKIGAIVYSKANNQDLFNNISAGESTGLNLSLEHKIMLKNKIYYSTNFCYQSTKTNRIEELFKGTINYRANQYIVNRTVFSIIPKVGFIFFNKKNIFIDLGLGVGVRYIVSRSNGKMDHSENLQKENFTEHIFDDGNKFAQRIVLQIKFGYNF